MLPNSTDEHAIPDSSRSAPLTSNSEPNYELRSNPSAGLPVAAAPSTILPLAKAESRPPDVERQIQKLESEVPDVGVLGVVNQLSEAEYIELLTWEEVVATAMTSWLDAGHALTRIRDKQLWRGNYLSFDEYCAKRWQFCRSKVYYLIGAASVCDTLKTVPGLPAPECESQLRALVRLDPPKRIEAWQRAVSRAGKGKITAAMVRTAAQAVRMLAPDSNQTERRREQLERRRQVRELMSQLLEFIMSRRPYKELIQKAAALDSQLRFFFPAPRKR